MPHEPMPSSFLKQQEKALLKLLSNPRFIYYKEVMIELVVAGKPMTLKALSDALGFSYVQRAYYYAEKLVTMGFIKKIKHNGRIFYAPNENTEPTLKLLILKSSTGSRSVEKSAPFPQKRHTKGDRIENSNSNISIRLHAFSMSSEIIQEGSDPSKPRLAKLRNWTARYYRIPTPEGVVTVKVTPRKAIFTAPPIRDDPEEAEKRAIRSIEHAVKVMHKFGWRLSPPQLASRPHWGVKAKEIPPFDLIARNVIVQNDVGSIDMSTGEEEVEIYEEDPLVAKRALMTFVQLPDRLEEIDRRIEMLEQATVKVASQLERLVNVFTGAAQGQPPQPGVDLPY